MRNKRNVNTARENLKDKLMAIILLETSKDYKEMDSDLVTECVDFLMELEEKQRLTKEEIEQRVNGIPFKGKVTAISSYAKKKIRAKRLAIVAAVIAVIITLFSIFAVASGDTLDELFRQIGNYIFESSGGSWMECDNITFIKPNETKTYSSIEELVKDEGIEILYPTWLPDNEKIVNILYMQEGESERYNMYCDPPAHGIEIDISANLSEGLKSNCIQKEIEGHLVYYEKTPQFVQANFEYKNNVYHVMSDSTDNLFKIIENLKEIN